MSDPICGNCGKPLSKHFHENEIFCFETTTGDLFTDAPSADHLSSFVETQYPELYAKLVAEWKRDNGHAPTSPTQ